MRKKCATHRGEVKTLQIISASLFHFDFDIALEYKQHKIDAVCSRKDEAFVQTYEDIE